MSEIAAGDWEDTPDATSGLARPEAAVDPDETLRPGPVKGAEQVTEAAAPPPPSTATVDNSQRGTHHDTTMAPTNSPNADNPGVAAVAAAGLSLTKAQTPPVAVHEPSRGASPAAGPGSVAAGPAGASADAVAAASGSVVPGVAGSGPDTPQDADQARVADDLETQALGEETIRAADAPVGTPPAPAATAPRQEGAKPTGDTSPTDASESVQAGLDAHDPEAGDADGVDAEATVVGLPPHRAAWLPVDDSAEINEVDRAAAIGAANGDPGPLGPGPHPQRDARKWIHVVRHGYVLRSRAGMAVAAAVVLIVLTLVGLTGLLVAGNSPSEGTGEAVVFVNTEAPTLDFASILPIVEPPVTVPPPSQPGYNSLQAQSVDRVGGRPRRSSANVPASHGPQPTSAAAAPTTSASQAPTKVPAPATSSSSSNCWTNFPAIATLLKRMGGC
ncbi:hypothetical protein [Pseudofrankia sp. DC12]|uniref:hypothetical protein n=1 Tax=Pseudofrankia sp. DC12 TaxID=683315 RepID=UPI0005F82BAA|nr:hypothetical protein [Pseudofrankia sp. DC12]